MVAYLSGAPAKLPSNERAHYSSGAVKEAEAVKRGAIGTISFTSPDDPRFRWDVSVATGKQGGYAWVDAQGNPNRGDAALRGSASLNHSGVAALFAGAPKPPADVFAAAATSTPQAFDLATRVSLVTRSRPTSDVESANLVGRLEGSDPALKDEHVVYVAHVDHFGRGVAMNGDEIYNGAHDNASGVAIVLEVARAYAALPTPPRRSVAVPVRHRRGAWPARVRLLRAQSHRAAATASWPTSRSTCRSCSTRCSTSSPTARSTRRCRRR